MTMRCPSCRSTSLFLIESYEEVETRTVRNGIVSRESDRWPGGLLRTECKCADCDHGWAPRQATLDTLDR